MCPTQLHIVNGHPPDSLETVSYVTAMSSIAFFQSPSSARRSPRDFKSTEVVYKFLAPQKVCPESNIQHTHPSIDVIVQALLWGANVVVTNVADFDSLAKTQIKLAPNQRAGFVLGLNCCWSAFEDCSFEWISQIRNLFQQKTIGQAERHISMIVFSDTLLTSRCCEDGHFNHNDSIL